jgi:hypothetical protein
VASRRVACHACMHDRVPKECFTNKEVGKLVSVLGFAKKRMNRGTVVIWNDAIVKRLNEQYGIIEKGELMKEKPPKTDNQQIFEKGFGRT